MYRNELKNRYPLKKQLDKMIRPKAFYRDIWEETVLYCKGQKDKIPQSDLITETPDLSSFNSDMNNKVKVNIVDQDFLNCAIDLQGGLEDRLCLIHSCHPKIKGGYTNNGSLGLEEDIFRRTDAFIGHPKKWYPIPLLNVFYLPQVNILRADMNEDYTFLLDPSVVSLISTPTIWKPSVTDGSLSYGDREMYRKIIERCVQTAIMKGHKHIIINAFGCGASKVPFKEASVLMKEVIDQYGSYLDQITIPIMSSLNIELYNTFVETFSS